MKKYIIISVLFTVVSVQAFCTDDFWTFIEKNELEKAKEYALKTSSDEEIYFLYLSVVYNLLGDLHKSSVARFDYYKNPYNNVKLTDLANDIYKEHNKESYVLSFLGIMLWENNYKDYAKKYLRESVESDNTNPYGNNYFSMIFYDRKNDQYLNYALQAIKFKSDYSEAYNNAAVAYMGLGQNDKAIETLKKCIENCPEPHINTYYNLLNLVGNDGISIKSRRDSWTIEGNSALGESDIMFVNELLVNYSNKYKQMIEVLIDRADYNEAYELIQLAKNQEMVICYDYYMAELSYLNNKDQDFIQYTSKLSISDELSYQDFYQVANIYYEMQLWEKAIEFYEVALKKLDDMDSLFGMRINANLGTTYLRFGEAELGLNYLLESLNYNPYDEIALTNIGYFYKQSGELEKAELYFNKALEYTTDEGTKNQIIELLNS